MTDPPFERHIHLLASKPTSETEEKITEFRAKLSRNPLYEKHKKYCSDSQLNRCLISKSFNLKASYSLISEAMQWREMRNVDSIESTEDWEKEFSLEGKTGKIYNPGFDRWGRPIVVFNSAVQNTKDVNGQMKFLAWSLELATRMMPESIDKYLVFMNLENFSFWNCPSMSSTKETIHMLCNIFPERMGHCIAYQPPRLFTTFFNSVKRFIDPKTAAKMIFVNGDVSDGSKNDKLMKIIIGEDWKKLTGACQPVFVPGCSPGFNHDEYWPELLKKVYALQKIENKKSTNISNSNLESNENILGSNKSGGCIEEHCKCSSMFCEPVSFTTSPIHNLSTRSPLFSSIDSSSPLDSFMNSSFMSDELRRDESSSDLGPNTNAITRPRLFDKLLVFFDKHIIDSDQLPLIFVVSFLFLLVVRFINYTISYLLLTFFAIFSLFFIILTDAPTFSTCLLMSLIGEPCGNTVCCKTYDSDIVDDFHKLRGLRSTFLSIVTKYRMMIMSIIFLWSALGFCIFENKC